MSLPVLTPEIVRELTLADQPHLLTLEQVSQVLRMDLTSVYDRVREGALPILPGRGRKYVPRLGLLGVLAGPAAEPLFRALLTGEEEVQPLPVRKKRKAFNAVHERRLARADRQAEQRQGGSR